MRMQEVDAFGRSKDLDFSDLESFKYTDAFFKETLRVFPPVTPQVALVSVFELFCCLCVIAAAWSLCFNGLQSRARRIAPHQLAQ